MKIFDIETCPLPEEHLREILPPFDESRYVVTEFDERTVKHGQTKDPVKRAEKTEAARAAHAKKMENLWADRKAAMEAHWDSFLDDAALSAVTGRVLCVAYCDPGGEVMIDSGDGESEIQIIERFWEQFARCRRANSRLAGLNIFDFDLPFLVHRSWILGIDLPTGLFDWWKHRLNWSEVFLDLRVVWLLGRYPGQAKSSFDTLAAAFGTQGKPDGITGADFARLWQEDRATAVDYVTQDVAQPLVWLGKMGLLPATKQAASKKKVELERVEF